MSRPPRSALRSLVKVVWTSDFQGAEDGTACERVLPTGGMHIVFRLSDAPLRLVQGSALQSAGHAVVGGARSEFYVRDISSPSLSVGAQLFPGSARLFFDVPAGELSERHTSLEDLWGPGVRLMRERLLASNTPAERLTLFESFLEKRLLRSRALHPVVAHALRAFAVHREGKDVVKSVVRDSGYSHRRFIALFREAVGLSPKVYSRVLRFHVALEQIAAQPSLSWAEVALSAGYSDQSHFNREFRAFAGVSPGDYRQLSPKWSHHVPIRSVKRGARSISFKTLDPQHEETGS